MRTMNYVACTHCGGEYYVEPNLARALAANPQQKLKCPFCKRDFQLKNPAAENRQPGRD
jgi:hypothetical protein